MADIYTDLKAALDGAAKTRRGKRAVEGHDEDFEFEVAGNDPIHLEIAGGKLKVNKGPSPRQIPLRFTRVQIDEPTLREILAGRMSPVAAMEQGRLFLRTRLYGGALATILLRSAYDNAREKALEGAL